LNCGKKSLAFDLKVSEERARLLPLIATAEVVVEQFRPGVTAGLGLSYEEIRHRH
jgi:crotonobetainyl-CoA:carnitine CoA-transferase CaiB-like acyl-CoA transferase